MTDERSDAPLADEPQPGAVPNDMPREPSGLPDRGAPEGTPLGPDETAPEGDAEPQRGAERQPGIPTEGEPPTGG